MSEQFDDAMQSATDKHKNVIVEVVEDELPLAQQKPKDVAMEEAEDLHVHELNEIKDEMEICNLADT